VKWLLILISLSVNDDYCDAPFPLLKHSDEVYGSEEECREAFHNLTFYKSVSPEQIAGFCLPVGIMYPSPKQLTKRDDRPTCYAKK